MTTRNRTGYPEQLHCFNCNRLANTECVEQGHGTSTSSQTGKSERVIFNSDLVVRETKTGYLLATDDGWPIAEFYREEEAEGIAYEHNQYSTLVEQRQFLEDRIAAQTETMAKSRQRTQRAATSAGTDSRFVLV